MQKKESEKACDVIIEQKSISITTEAKAQVFKQELGEASKPYWNAKKSFKVVQRWVQAYWQKL